MISLRLFIKVKAGNCDLRHGVERRCRCVLGKNWRERWLSPDPIWTRRCPLLPTNRGEWKEQDENTLNAQSFVEGYCRTYAASARLVNNGLFRHVTSKLLRKRLSGSKTKKKNRRARIARWQAGATELEKSLLVPRFSLCDPTSSSSRTGGTDMRAKIIDNKTSE